MQRKIANSETNVSGRGLLAILAAGEHRQMREVLIVYCLFRACSIQLVLSYFISNAGYLCSCVFLNKIEGKIF